MTISNRGGPGEGRVPFPMPAPLPVRVHEPSCGCAAEAADSPLLRALVARFLDPDASRAHVGPPAPVSPTAPLR
ncbi:MAG: hypothetical protein V2I65_15445 [Paracoccaceae bacterium]|jgi:hypothetical protein|nr:hypothetical protein [Paracoccaceae bacterium]